MAPVLCDCKQDYQLTSVSLLHSAQYLQLQRYFTYVQFHERRNRKLYNLRKYVLPNQTYLPVVILTASILFEGIVPQTKFLGDIFKTRVLNISFFTINTQFSEVVM